VLDYWIHNNSIKINRRSRQRIMSQETDEEMATSATVADDPSPQNPLSFETTPSQDEPAAPAPAAPAPAAPAPVEEKQSIQWNQQKNEDEEGNAILVIEEESSSEPPPRSHPLKKSWTRSQPSPQPQPQQQQKSMHAHNSVMNNSHNYNTAAEARRNNQRQQQQHQQQQQQNPGSKPKLSNLSLLSSAVAHATLERCLLGVNGGETTTTNETTHNQSPNTTTGKDNNLTRGSSNSSNHNYSIDYSKQCKPGHVIDILELRRLSSRGVPDEPPPEAHRARTASAPSASGGEPSFHTNNNEPSLPIGFNNGWSGSLQNPHRSYRPLVWRVLLGYLPPQTSLWNEVLARDRKLYDTLVHELFSNTCPAPHDYYGEEELAAQQTPKGEEADDSNDGVPKTPVESAGAAPPPPPASVTPMTPGLLSARMQQEWVRGEDGKGSIFHNDSDGGNTTPGSNHPNMGHTARLSPMCAMNTPRTRIRKEVFKSPNLSGVEERSERQTTAESSMAGMSDVSLNDTAKKEEEEDLTNRMKESLLLPHDEDGENSDGDEDEEGGIMGTISIENEEEVTVPTTTNSEPGNGDSSPTNASLTRSISITNVTSSGNSEDDGIEIRRQGSNDADAVPPMSSPSTVAPDEEEENAILLDEIRKDVIRTHPDLRFFLEPNEDLGQKRYAALERILFVWAKLNKGVRYVQGMNEIVGTLYFVLAHDTNDDWARSAEADTYFLFNSLMVEMRDVFVPDLDEADTGIHGRISNMITLLSLHDPEVRCHLDSVGIDPSFYSVRWLTTLLSREFLLPDTIRLWDSMFASTHKDNFLRYVSVTMVMVIRDQLLTGDFSACLRLLQAYPPTNLDRLLESSRALWIYESQITLACHKGGISLGHALRSIAPPPAIIMAYGLERGVAPPMREQVRAAGERGLRVAREKANGIASSGMASAGRSFLGNAMSFWRGGNNNNNNGGENSSSATRRSKSTL